jgi:molybdopterin converting factor subunit 1
MTAVHVQYYALLREQAGCSEERVVTGAATPAALYEELRVRHGLTLARAQLRVAVDGEFADWQAPLADGARVVFIPPVAGG